MRVRIALTVCFALMAIAIAVSLERSPPVRAGSDWTPLPTEVGATFAPDTVCQSEETLPKGTTIIRMTLLSLLGPRVKVRVMVRGQVVTTGEKGSGWTGTVVAVPVTPVARTYTHATVCFTLSKRQQLVNYRGANTTHAPAVSNGTQVLPGRIRIEYLKPGKESWLSLALPTARRIGLTIGGGGGIVLVPFVLLLTAAGLSSWLLVRELE
ncbi:MAG: hypothetical protein ACHQDY_09325 [Solirubrobacterales bacterium]